MRANTGIGIRVLALLLGCGALEARAQAGEFMPPITNTQALQAHQVQGEYFGTTTTGEKLGAWVVARGNNSYALTLLPGGLVALVANDPNGGWGGTTKYTGTGTLSGTTFNVTTANGYKTTAITGSGETRVLAGTTSGNVAFTLNRVVRQSPTRRMKPKAAWGSASVWFDSTTAQADKTKWKQRDNAVEVKYGFLYRGILSAAKHGAGYLHIESRSSFNPTATGQGRSNSGIYLQGKFEMQVMDSFGLTGENNETGSIYSIKAPLVNASLPPLTFQTYDCYFTPFTTANKMATITLYLNGVLVQDKTTVDKVTEAGITGDFYAESELYLQNHGNEVVYDNVWFIPGATTTSLPFNTVLSSVTTEISRPEYFGAAPARESRGIDLFGLRDGIDVTGRKVENGVSRSLMIFPAR